MPTHSRKTILLATDQQRSVLSALDGHQPRSIAYTPYGHRPRENGLLSLLGFNGELPDPLTGCYHLGNGYRQFNPVLMRFNSPDSWSPFGEGGLNAYGYCGGDPGNRVDPTGHKWGLLKAISRNLGLRESAKAKLAKKFNADPTAVAEPSRLFTDDGLRKAAGLDNPTSTNKLIYLEKTNSLYLKREVTNNKFSFSSLVKINSKSNALSQETLLSIKPEQHTQIIDPATYKYISNINKQLNSLGSLGKVEINKILHPVIQRNIRANEALLKRYSNEPKTSPDPRRFDYRSGAGF